LLSQPQSLCRVTDISKGHFRGTVFAAVLLKAMIIESAGIVMRVLSAAFVAAAVIVSQPVAAQQRSVLTYHGDESRTGNYVVPAMTFDKARSVHPERAFDAHVDGHLYAQPLYWRAPGSNTAMILTASESDVVQAFGALSGKELWRRSVGRPVPGSSLPCGNINPLGITGTPVIDPSTQAIYFDADVEEADRPHHEVFALSLKDGSILKGWPVDVTAALQKTGRHFDARTQNQRTALSLVDGKVYIGFGGHFGDCGDYHGWVLGLPMNDPSNIVSFESRARGGAVWAPGGLSVVGNGIFFSTGNTFGARTWSDGEAVFRLATDLRRSDNKRDFFAPSDWRAMDAGDEDLGGSNPVPVNVSGPGKNQALMIALGKDHKAYLLDRNKLGGIGGQLDVLTASTGPIRTAPAVYPANNDAMVAFQGPGEHCPSGSRGNGLTVLKITGGSKPAMSTAWCGELDGRGSAIVTTTDGHSNPIVWILGAEGDNRLHAFRGDTGEPIYTSEPMRGLRHFQTLIATQDRLYVGADGRVYAFDF
jgi:outer membrane protein assembly factor BamB